MDEYPDTAAPPTGGAGLIAAERRRQVEVDGYSAKRDRRHDRRELLAAAACYVVDAYDPATGRSLRAWAWPWRRSSGTCGVWLDVDLEGWKPTPDDPIRQLVKAGALVAAEIDRLLAVDPKRRRQ